VSRSIKRGVSETWADALPWLSVIAEGRRDALAAARVAVAEALEVEPEMFDVEA